MKILADLSKAKKRERTPKRASPMSLAMLTRIITFLETDSSFNQTMRVWFSAVCSLAFHGMCGINEVLLMKKGDIQLGLQRRSRKNGATIKFGCFTLIEQIILLALLFARVATSATSVPLCATLTSLLRQLIS
ncbi:hypothetical protein JG688_00015249, partial [Phytophthora aleatoria]